jgi:hypothetical protein
VDSLENGQMLRQNLEELQQTVALLQSDNHDEFFDVSTRNKKYGRVDALNGPMLLEKYIFLPGNHCTHTDVGGQARPRRPESY